DQPALRLEHLAYVTVARIHLEAAREVVGRQRRLENEEAQGVRGLLVQEDPGPLEGHDAAQGLRDGPEELVPGQARDHGIVDLEQRAIPIALGIHRRPGPPRPHILDPGVSSCETSATQRIDITESSRILVSISLTRSRSP